jgi:hypothetical protein
MAKFKLHDDGTIEASTRGMSAREARYKVVQRTADEIEAALWALVEDIQYIDAQCHMDGTDDIDDDYDDDDDDVDYEDLADDE